MNHLGERHCFVGYAGEVNDGVASGHCTVEEIGIEKVALEELLVIKSWLPECPVEESEHSEPAT